MAIDLTLKSADLTRRDATPPTAGNPGAGGIGVKKFVQGYIASVPALLSATSIIRLVDVPAHCYIKSVKFFTEAQGAASTFDVGLYKSPNGAVIDADFFGSAVATSARVDGTEIMNESAVATIADRILPLWEAAGVAIEPAKGTMYEIAVTNVAAVVAGLVPLGIEVEYIE